MMMMMMMMMMIRRRRRGTLMRQYMHANRCIDTKSISTSRRIRIRDGRMSHSSARMLPPSKYHHQPTLSPHD